MIEVNRENLAWAAGFFDGEGTVGCRKGPKKVQLQLKVGQADPETLEKFLDAIGFGKIYGPYTHDKRPNRKPMWNYTVTKHEHVQAAIAMMWPFLGTIKREDALRALTTYRNDWWS